MIDTPFLNLFKRKGRLTGLGMSLTVLLFVSFFFDLILPKAGQTSPKTPVATPLVLISEPVKGVGEASGADLWQKSGLVSRLVSSGYEEGKTLFVYTPDKAYGDLHSGAWILKEKLTEIKAKQGCGTLDVAAYGVSGFVLRFGLEMGFIEDGLIGNAIMLNTPQRGSFLADFLSKAVNIVKHECMFELETRRTRFLPFGEVSPTMDASFIPAKSGGELPGFIGTDLFSWESETWWVAKRAREIYEPLYGQYVLERFLTLPYVPIDSPKQTFAGWIKENRPLLWDNCIASSSIPPFGPGSTEGLDTPPPKGQDLTTAYYELLAMAVGKNQYVVRMASSGSLVQSLLAGEHVPGDVKDLIIQYGFKALLHYAKKAFVTVKAGVQKMITDSILASIGYLDSPESSFLRRLMKEDVLVNLGTSAGQRFVRVPVNHYLSLINQKSFANSGERKTRFINITGKVMNVLGMVWPQIGANNLFCEVDSAISPLGPRDVVQVFSGLLAPSYLNLLKDKRVHDSIVSLLLDQDRVQEVSINTSETKAIPVSSWYPYYLSVPWDLSESQVFDVSLGISTLPEGWRCILWIEGYKGDQWLPILGWNQTLASGAGTRAVLKNSSYRVGLRLTRIGNVNLYSPEGRVESVFEKELLCEAWASVDRVLSAILDEQDWPASGQVPGLGPGLVPEPGVNPEKPDTGFEAGAEIYLPGVPENPGAGEDIPAVRVVYRSKHTTLWNPQETYHSYWELDFGDGQVIICRGEPHLVFSHTFNPGKYVVRAISYDNHQNVLLEADWKLEIAGERAERREFSCKSVIPPQVDLGLTGPLKWVTGKHALFSGKVRCLLPSEAKIIGVDYDPGESFHVLWERSGDFTVFWAVRLTMSYELEHKTIKIKNTYVTSQDVDVFAPGITH